MATLTIAAIANALEAGLVNGQFLITASEAPTSDLTVFYSIAGTAEAADYTPLTGTATISAGQTTTTINVIPVNDTLAELNETVVVTLLDGDNYDLDLDPTTTQATVTIVSDDTDVTLAVLPASVDENGTGNLVYTFTRAGVTSNALTVNFTVGGTATLNTDYQAFSADSFTSTAGSVTFIPGAPTATVIIAPTGDTTVEPNETVALTLAAGTGANTYTIQTVGAVTGTITNDDVAPPTVTLAVSPASVTEDGAGTLVYTFTRTATAGALTVNYTVGGTATFNTDYTQTNAESFTATTGSVTFANGSDTATVTIVPTDDVIGEADETVALTLAAGTGDNSYTIGTTAAVTGTIVNDDSSISLAVSPASVAEDGTGNLVYTFTRAGITSSAVTVNYTVGGTATFGGANADYTTIGAGTFDGATGTVNFAANQTTATVTIDPIPDTVDEANETVALTLATGTGYTIATTTAVTGTINDDDVTLPTVTLAVFPASVIEDGTGNLVYTFTRTTDVNFGSSLTVNYTVGGTATFGATNDYQAFGATNFTATTGSVIFAPNVATATVTIDPTTDTIVEPNETVVLTLATGATYTRGTTTAVTGTIDNDDLPRITLALAPGSVQEDGTSNLVYTFTRDQAFDTTLTVNFTVGTQAGAATFETDYTQIGATSFTTTTGSVTFASGSSTATVTIDPSVDTVQEPNETVALTLLPSIVAAPVAIPTLGVGSPYPSGIIVSGLGNIATLTVTLSNINHTYPDDIDVLLVGPTGASVLLMSDVGGGFDLNNVTLTFDPTAGNPLLPDDTQITSGTYLPTNIDAGDVFNAPAPVGPYGVDLTVFNGTNPNGVWNLYVVDDEDPDSGSISDWSLNINGNTIASRSYTIGTTTAVTGTIVNDDISVSLAVSPASVAEDGTGNLVYTFTRAGSTSGSLTVNYTVGGVATFNEDYTVSGAGTFNGTTGTVTFADGSSTATVTIDPIADTVVESGETVILTLASGTGYQIGTTPAVTGTINNDDTRVTLAVAPSSVLENGTQNLVYTFTREGLTTNALTVNYTVGGTATFNTDYTTPSFTGATGTVSFLATETTATVTIDPTADIISELDETVVLTLASGTGYTVGTSTAVTGTITNAVLPNVTLAVSPDSVQENGTQNLVYTFTRDNVNLSSPLTVSFNVQGTPGAATLLGTDYTAIGAETFTDTTGTVTFASGSNTATVIIDPTDDTDLESDEAIALTLAAGNSTYTIGTIGAVTGTIVDDDTPRISLAVSPASVQEDGTPNLVYTFTRTGNTAAALTVNYTVAGTATTDDYIGATPGITNQVGFAVNSATATVTINPTADTVIEPDETVALTLAAGTGGNSYTIGTTAAVTGTIVNDDTSVTLAVSPASVLEEGTENLVYTFTRTGVTSNALTVNYTVAGTATLNTDYTTTSFTGTTGTVSFAANETTATVTIDPTAELVEESDETVALTLASGTGYTIGTPTAVTGTIADDDVPRVTLAVSPASVLEDGTQNLVYTFTRTVTTNALTVNFTLGTQTGAATLGTDYAVNGTTITNGAGTVTFDAGVATAIVTIDPTADTAIESNETVALSLATGTGYTIGTTTPVTGTILNDDTNVTIAVSPTSVQEDGTSNLVYTFTRTGTTADALTVNYTVGGQATFGTDYIAVGAASFTTTTGSVTFASGSSTATVTIDPTADTTGEADETVTLALAPGAYTIGTEATATGTILNEDTSISLSVSPASVEEDGTGTLLYTFTRVGGASNAITVNYTVGGTATLNTDYTAVGATTFTPTTGSINFATGQTTTTVTIDPIAETTVEADETVTLTLAAGTGYTIDTTAGVTGTIADDDSVLTPVVTIAATDADAAEEGLDPGLFTITLSEVAPVGGLTVNYGVTGTATAATDYTALTGTVTIAAGDTTATIAVIPVEDALVEGNESVIVTLTDGEAYDLGVAREATVTIADNDVAPTWTLDIDGNGIADALSDGIIAVRYLFGGFPGDALIDGAIAPDATRDLAGIQSYLQQGVDQDFLDIDGNGIADALSDGIIAVRYLFGGFPGDALIDGAIAPDATRDLAGIQSYLADLTTIV